jgi:hypothetical protein
MKTNERMKEESKERKEGGVTETIGFVKTIKCTGRFVGSQILRTVVMKNYTSWDIMPFSPLKVKGRFGFTLRETASGTHCIRVWVGPRPGLG